MFPLVIRPRAMTVKNRSHQSQFSPQKTIKNFTDIFYLVWMDNKGVFCNRMWPVVVRNWKAEATPCFSKTSLNLIDRQRAFVPETYLCICTTQKTRFLLTKETTLSLHLISLSPQKEFLLPWFPAHSTCKNCSCLVNQKSWSMAAACAACTS